MEFLLQPNVYSTNNTDSLLSLLDSMWIKGHKLGDGTLYIVSGFANYNGGVRFYPYFSNHIQNGGKIVAYIGGSTSQKLSTIQVATALLECGVEVNIVNRKRLLHAKCYGYKTTKQQELIVSSGNFTGPGMSQNAEATLHIDSNDIQKMNFQWDDFISNIKNQNWDIHKLTKKDIKEKKDPGWKLLYNEVDQKQEIEDSEATTMIIKLSHSDTARIQAERGSDAGKGTQYFWLSKSSFDFFPALTEKNKRGRKNTYSCNININYIDIGKKTISKVTFEADNNLDFRLGTAPLKYTKIAKKDDLAVLTRTSNYDYELRIIKKKHPLYSSLLSYATSYIGNLGKRVGFISNSDFFELMK